MLVAPAVGVYLRERRHDIDWTMIRTAVWLYLATFIVYGFVYSIKTVGKLDSERATESKRLRELLEVQVAVTGMRGDDPMIEPSFVDGRKGALGGMPYLELKNRGTSIAYFVRLRPLRLKERTVEFPGFSDSISPTDYRAFYVDAGNQWGEDRKADLVRVMSEEWNAYEDSETRREILIPAQIDFEDDVGTRFECNFDLLYHGGKGWNQPVDFKCIECRNLIYRRIPKGITPTDNRA